MADSKDSSILAKLVEKIDKLSDELNELKAANNKAVALIEAMSSGAGSSSKGGSSEKAKPRKTIVNWLKEQGPDFFVDKGYIEKERFNAILKKYKSEWDGKKPEAIDKAKVAAVYKYLTKGTDSSGDKTYGKESGKEILDRIKADRDKADGIEPKSKKGGAKKKAADSDSDDDSKKSKGKKKAAADSDSDDDNEKEKNKSKGKKKKSDDEGSDSDKPAKKGKGKKKDSSDDDSS